MYSWYKFTTVLVNLKKFDMLYGMKMRVILYTNISTVNQADKVVSKFKKKTTEKLNLKMSVVNRFLIKCCIILAFILFLITIKLQKEQNLFVFLKVPKSSIDK